MARNAAGPTRAAAPTRLLPRPDLARRGNSAGQFLREVWSELRKVVFPTRRELFKLTGLVIGVSVAIGFLLGGVDFVFAQLMRLILG
ncbi:MAG: preprotein translocase subunit SecE [Chloroflexi bacterium]|nr:preprotein translocase subunit SecE [Chloroflexota bacterium]